VNIKIPEYMQKDFIASIFYNSNNLDKRNYAYQNLIIENDAAFWRSSIVNECIFDLQEKKLICQFIDGNEMEWDMPRYCEIKLNTIITKFKRGKRKISLEKKKLIEKEEARKKSLKESQFNSNESNSKSKKMFSNFTFSLFPFTSTAMIHNKANKEGHGHHHRSTSGNDNTTKDNDNDTIIKNNIKEMIPRKMYEFLKSKLKSELIDIYTHYIQHDYLNDILPQNYYIWLTNSYLHRYEQHILETESMMRVQIYGMEVLNDALKKMRQEFIARFIEINHDKELYESLEVRLQDINSLIIDKKTKTMNHESSSSSSTSKKLGILKFFKRSGQKHKEESKEIREVKRLKTEMKEIQFMMSSLKLTADPSKRIVQSKALIRDRTILPVVKDSSNNNTTLLDEESMSIQPNVLSPIESSDDKPSDVINLNCQKRGKKEASRLPSKKQRALKYKGVDEFCFKIMMNDLNIEENYLLKYLSIKMNYNETNELESHLSPEEATLLAQPLSTIGTEVLAAAPMDDKKRKYLDYRKMISNLPQPKFILLHFLYPPFLNNMKRGILHDINELRDEIVEQLIHRFLGTLNDLQDSSNLPDTMITNDNENNVRNDTNGSNNSKHTTYDIIERLVQRADFIDSLFEKVCNPHEEVNPNYDDFVKPTNLKNNLKDPSPSDTMMMDTEEPIDNSNSIQTIINERDQEHSHASPSSLELPFKTPLISSTNDQLMVSENIIPATPTLLSTVSSFITTTETTAEESLTQISNISNNGSPQTKDTISHKERSTKVTNPIDSMNNESEPINENHDMVQEFTSRDSIQKSSYLLPQEDAILRGSGKPVENEKFTREKSNHSSNNNNITFITNNYGDQNDMIK
jgi:hypothetical protein